MTAYESLRSASLHDLRAAIRSDSYGGHTAGLAAGRLQTNLAIMPEACAADFLLYCQ